MEIVCQNCGSQMNLPDSKLPEGRAFFVTCQRCRNKITVNARVDDKTAEIGAVEADAKGLFDSSDFEFELSMAYDKTALVCDNKHRKLLRERLDRLEYGVQISLNPEDAISHIRFTMFDTIILHESFGGSRESNTVLKYIQPLQMSVRRKIFVILVSESIRTLDNLQALANSVNLVINSRDLLKFDIIFKKQLQDNDFFYKIYKETLKEITGYW